MKRGCFCFFDTSLIMPHKLHSRVWQVKIYTARKVKVGPACTYTAQILVDCCYSGGEEPASSSGYVQQHVITDGTLGSVWYVYLYQLYPNWRNLKLFSVTLEWDSESVWLLHRFSDVVLIPASVCLSVCVCVGWLFLVQMRGNQAQFVYLGKAWEIRISTDFASNNTVCLTCRKTEGAPDAWEWFLWSTFKSRDLKS